MRLHEEQARIIRKTKRNVSAGKVVLAFGDQHFPGHDQLLFDRSMSRLATSPLPWTKSCIRVFAFGHCPTTPDYAPAQQNREFKLPQAKNRIAAPGGTAHSASPTPHRDLPGPRRAFFEGALGRLAVDLAFR